MGTRTTCPARRYGDIDAVSAKLHSCCMAERHDPGREPDTLDYRHCRPPTPCEGRVPAIATPDGLPRWCPGHVEVWQRRRWGADPKVHGPDGWWAWGSWYLEPGKRWGG